MVTILGMICGEKTLDLNERESLFLPLNFDEGYGCAVFIKANGVRNSFSVWFITCTDMSLLLAHRE